MTTLDKAQLITDLQNIIAHDPTEIELVIAAPGTNEKHNGVKSTFVKTEDVAAAGLDHSYKFSITIVVSEWTRLPVIDDLVLVETEGTEEFRVMRAANDSVDVGRRLDIGSKYANREPAPAFGSRF